VERNGFELPSPLIAGLFWWSVPFSLLRRFRHGRGLAESVAFAALDTPTQNVSEKDETLVIRVKARI
jgi:hypothetical protein